MHGARCFFYDATATAWRSDWTEGSRAAVVYVSDPADTRIPEWPDGLPEEARYDIRYLSAHETIALPPIDSPVVRAFRLTDDRYDAYQQFVAQPRARMGGHRDFYWEAIRIKSKRT